MSALRRAIILDDAEFRPFSIASGDVLWTETRQAPEPEQHHRKLAIVQLAGGTLRFGRLRHDQGQWTLDRPGRTTGERSLAIKTVWRVRHVQVEVEEGVEPPGTYFRPSPDAPFAWSHELSAI